MAIRIRFGWLLKNVVACMASRIPNGDQTWVGGWGGQIRVADEKYLYAELFFNCIYFLLCNIVFTVKKKSGEYENMQRS